MNRLTFGYLLLCVHFILNGCYKETFIPSGDGLEDWSFTTHSSSAPLNYDMVFPQDKVNRLDIKIETDDWQEMRADLDDLYGSGVSPGGPGGPGNAGGGSMTFAEETPVYVPCTVEFNDMDWYYVGIRYKGNSSLSAYSQGVNKLPFRLDFDQFEEEYPAMYGQTFYGFPALSMSSNYSDQSFLREKIGADLFREFGVPAPETAFYELYIDYGDGPVYFGLYTAVEVVFESMLKTQFGSDHGNCYKPEDDGAAFAVSGFDLDDFENKTTGGTGLEDITELYEILHDNTRVSNPDSWKSQLEEVFDVDGFLKWLAVNTTIQNWDTYGNMTHNYYLYHDPADDLIKWIPWDNNEAFQDGKSSGALSFSFSEVNDDEWPLIGYLINMPEYEEMYKNHIRNFIEGVFATSEIEERYDYWANVVESSVEKETKDYSFIDDLSDFYGAIATLKLHASSRFYSADEFVN